jgi:hypothetical protein
MATLSRKYDPVVSLPLEELTRLGARRSVVISIPLREYRQLLAAADAANNASEHLASVQASARWTVPAPSLRLTAEGERAQ